MTATTLFVVPKSIPMILPISVLHLFAVRYYISASTTAAVLSVVASTTKNAMPSPW
jgi:hypothetical protein